MCGLAGILELGGAPASPVVVQAMADAIAHRGPDGEGAWCEGSLALGHRRLAVLDPTPRGHQPMLSRDQRYVLAYNGEVYNFRELRARLEAEGHGPFRSHTDTEVVLEALAAWGPGAIERFNGMFALAFYDTVERTLLLARDRYGIKPLYYTRQGQTLLFGSEVKALRAHPDFRTRVCGEALHEYFTFQNIFTDRTLFEGVRTLPPGTLLRATLGREPEITRYWDFRFEADPNIDAETAEAETARLFEQAVERQLVSDVPLGTYLSGGIDSGSVTCVASRRIPNLRTFTCGFDTSTASGLELACDEREKAEYLAARFKTEHYQVVLKAGDMERVMRPLIWNLETPRVGQSYPNFHVARLASRFSTVVLGGTGGDELFAGYPWRYYVASRDNEHPDEYLGKYYAYWQRLIPDELKRDFFRPSLHGVLREHDTAAVFKSVHADALHDARTPEDYVNFSLYFEAKTFLQGLLHVEDRVHMAHGVESRVPFLDNDLVDFATRIPVKHKLRSLHPQERIDENVVGRKPDRYFARTNDGKLILRKVLSRYVPESYALAPKQGFSAPDGSWFRGESMDYLRRLFVEREARIYEYLQPDTVRGLMQEHFDGQRNRRLFIWSCLCFEWWLRIFEPEA